MHPATGDLTARIASTARTASAAVVVAAAVVAAAVLAGCSSDLVVNSGPLGGAQQPGITCGVADAARA